MKKLIILILSVSLFSCAESKIIPVSTIKVKDEKAQKISDMMKGYVDNNFDSSIIADDAKIKFNQLEMTKADFVDLVKTHHAMFSEISFPDGWMETTNYSGADVKNAGGRYLDGYGTTWTSQWSDWSAVSKISGDTLSNACFFGYKWESDKIVEVQAIFPDEAFNKEFAMYHGGKSEIDVCFKI